MRTLVHSLNNFAFPNSLIHVYTIPNFVNLCIYSPVEHIPVLCQMVFKRNSDVHSYPTRIAHDPHFVARTNPNQFFSKFFMYQAPVAWSKLPVLTKSCKTIQTFNYHVKRYFINAY